MSRCSCIRLMVGIMLTGLLLATQANSTTKGNISQSIDRFGLRLFQEIVSAAGRDSNVCISPISVSYALAMTYNGAAGQTREAMASTLAISDFLTNDADVNDAFSELTTLLTETKKKVTMEIANSIWIRSGLRVKPEFTQLCRSKFNALIREMDFTKPEVVDTINQWVASNTNDKIKTIIDPPIDPTVIMFLINAIYFNAPWKHPFDPELTKAAPFSLSDGSQTECRMMYRLDTYDYMENDQFQAIDLPYGDGELGMSILLPKRSINIDGFIKTLNEKDLDLWLRKLEKINVRLHLPRFKFSSDFALNQILKAMGMEVAFDPRADFSNMVDKGVWIDSVIHKAFIQVDEKGTEAAAATVVILKKGFVPTMVVDRPFLFVIRECQSGTVLFLGKVVNPMWEDE